MPLDRVKDLVVSFHQNHAKHYTSKKKPHYKLNEVGMSSLHCSKAMPSKIALGQALFVGKHKKKKEVGGWYGKEALDLSHKSCEHGEGDVSL